MPKKYDDESGAIELDTKHAILTAFRDGVGPSSRGGAINTALSAGVSPLRDPKVLRRQHFHFATDSFNKWCVRKRSGSRDPMPLAGTIGEERIATPHLGPHIYVGASPVVEPVPPGF